MVPRRDVGRPRRTGPTARGSSPVAVPGEEPKRFNNLKTASPQFKATTWLGFISDGVQNAVYYLDNIRLSNSGE